MTDDLLPPSEFSPEPLKRLTKDIREAARTLDAGQARFFVDAYYAMQRDRIRAGHQVRTLTEGGEPHDAVVWLQAQSDMLEVSIRGVLHAYAKANVVGKWALSIVGIGPVMSAGLLAHLNVQPWKCMNPKRDKDVRCTEAKPCTTQCYKGKTETVGHWWRFAGLDPTVKWDKGQKRPWNASLKRLCWLMGESFTKNQHRENDFYGKFYVARKAQEDAKNTAKLFADQAKASLEQKNWRKDTSTRTHYEQGMLPPARIHLRAQRYAVKLFLSHYHQVAYYAAFGKLPPKPFVIAHLGHVDQIAVPNWPF